MSKPSKPLTHALKLTASLTLLLIQLAACGQAGQISPAPVASVSNSPNNVTSSPTPADTPSSSKVIFGSATSKRTLDLNALPANSGILPTGGRTPTATPSAAASAAPSSDISVSIGSSAYGTGYGYGMGYGGGYSPFLGGGDFNTYIPVQAEESIFAGNSSQELLDVHAQTIVPMLKEWDPQARLIESRGNTSPGNQYNPSVEYISIPAMGTDQPIQLRPAWIFRYASSPRKETLTIYVMHKETRVYRVSWSEPNLDLAQVKISVAKAQDIARKAIADTNSKPGYPVYPESVEYMGPSAKVLYTVPADLNWSVNLGQQGKQQIYYLSYSYREDITRPGIPVILPSSQSSQTPAAFTVTQLSGSAEPTSTPIPSGSPIPATSTPTPYGTAYPTSSPNGESSAPYPDCLPEYARYLYIGGYVSIDASTGKVISLNRPVRYDYYSNYYGSNCHAPGATGYPSPMPSATSDI